jgi:hypothetical protein
VTTAVADVEAVVKECAKCHELLPLDQFHRRYDGHQSWCRTCKIMANGVALPRGTTMWLACSFCAETFKRIAKNGQRRTGNVYCSDRCCKRAAGLRKKYGLEPEQFRAMWIRQSGMCAMPGCLAVLGMFGASGHHVDHDHETGEVRGLLCHRCNVGLGWWERMCAVGADIYLGGGDLSDL